MNDTPNEASIAVKPARKRRGGYLYYVVVTILVLFLLGYVGWSAWSKKVLQDTLAELDRTDPGWRLEDLEANRKVVPDGENSAPIVVAASQMLPAGWTIHKWDKPEPWEDPWITPPETRLNDEQIWGLTLKLEDAERALIRAREVAVFPRGRHSIRSDGRKPWAVPMPHLEQVGIVSYLLSYDAILRVQEDDADGAMISCRAAVNARRSLGDEPAFDFLWGRWGWSWHLRVVQRLLGQGRPGETTLASLQQLLEEDELEPAPLSAARNKRAMDDTMMEALQKRELTFQELNRLSPGTHFNPTGPNDFVSQFIALGATTRQRAAVLKYNTSVVELVKLPFPEQQARMGALHAAIQNEDFIVRAMAQVTVSIIERFRGELAVMRAGIVMLAAERYRRARGAWPDTLTDLTPEYITSVPADPFDEAPLRYRRTPNGIVIYSVGSDGRDDGGKVGPGKPGVADSDYGFRLFDVEARRQPPPPPKIEPQKKDLKPVR